MDLDMIKINKYKSIFNQNFLIKKNKLIPIVGENNAGKTNLLECINLLNKVMNSRDFQYINERNEDQIEHLIKNKSFYFNENILDLDYDVDFYFKIKKPNIEVHTVIIKVKNSKVYLLNLYESLKFILKFSKKMDNKINHIFNKIDLYGKSNLYVSLKQIISAINLKNSSEKNSLEYKTLIEQKNLVNSLKTAVYKVKENISNYVFLDKDNLITFEESFTEFTELIENFFLEYKKILNFPKFYYISSLFDNQKVSNLVAKINENREIEKGANFDLINEIAYSNNIEKVIQEINFNESLENINRFLSEQIKLNTEDIDNNYWCLYLSKNENKYDLKVGIIVAKNNMNMLSYQSLGTLKNFFYRLLLNKVENISDKQNCYIILDEPDSFLHIDRQKKLLDEFFKLTLKRNNITIIYSTHSVFMLDFKCLFSINIIKKDKEGSKIELSNSVKDTNSKLESTIPAIIKGMGACISTYNFKKNILIVEGQSDFLYLHYFSEILNINLEFDIIYSAGASKVPYFNDIIKIINKNVICLLDNDDAGDIVFKKNYKRMNLLNFYKQNNKKEIEDLFFENKMKKEQLLKFINKDFNLKEYPWNIKTKKNFTKILEYINEEFNRY
ncbi:AAA family ATPase [Spiroplasma endosymbiont of Cantharis nigra]|uniref:AAA family ATPase n=1 Tax=Spiroplasma endosymbiont of Cantharis nigra TaxID=3066278 RepID=UPI0030D4BC7A